MRQPSALANAIVTFFIVALLAGCSRPQGTPVLPLGMHDSADLTASRSSGTIALLNEAKTPSQFLQLQVEGRLPAPIPLEVLRANYALQGVRPNLAFHAGAKVAIWASDTNFNYLVGQNSTGLKTVTAVDVSKNNCYSPVALKVDHNRNVWVGCPLISPSGNNGVVQEYSPAGAFEKQFLPGCPAPLSECKSFSGYGFDSGLDALGNVFASLNLYSIEICNPTCVSSLSAGFEWWPKGKQSATPRLISVGTNCSPICGVGYMDVDANGNLWFTFSGYDQNSNFGFGLGEITKPTTSPALTIVEPIGTYGFFGGVYISNKGKTLNVIDQKSRTILQYHLPLAKGGSPFNVFGPTPQNAFGVGTPVSGAFNQLDTKIAIGDSGGWLDLGVVASNTWSDVASPNFYSGIEGAAFTPSDK